LGAKNIFIIFFSFLVPKMKGAFACLSILDVFVVSQFQMQICFWC